MEVKVRRHSPSSLMTFFFNVFSLHLKNKWEDWCLTSLFVIQGKGKTIRNRPTLNLCRSSFFGLRFVDCPLMLISKTKTTLKRFSVWIIDLIQEMVTVLESRRQKEITSPVWMHTSLFTPMEVSVHNHSSSSLMIFFFNVFSLHLKNKWEDWCL